MNNSKKSIQRDRAKHSDELMGGRSRSSLSNGKHSAKQALLDQLAQSKSDAATKPLYEPTTSSNGSKSAHNLNDSVEIADGFKSYLSAQRSIEEGSSHQPSVEIAHLSVPTDSSNSNYKSSLTNRDSDGNTNADGEGCGNCTECC